MIDMSDFLHSETLGHCNVSAASKNVFKMWGPDVFQLFAADMYRSIKIVVKWLVECQSTETMLVKACLVAI